MSVAQILRFAGVELVCARDVPARDGRPARMGARMFSLVRSGPREGRLSPKCPIDSYAGHLGLAALRDDIYEGPSQLLIRRIGHRADAPAPESYAAAQKRLGMDRQGSATPPAARPPRRVPRPCRAAA